MISVRDLVKRFPKPGGEVVAVDHLTFNVEPGEVYGLLGPNGAGKTTTLRMILGLMNPTSGLAEIAGFRVDVNPNEVKSRIGYLLGLPLGVGSLCVRVSVSVRVRVKG